ncbi:acetyl-CoA hydrolase/transferase C-terminal domain-containing protein [Pseudonocardia sp. GCM10023141]|uniref:acetyl-CoA hydrolase/transferase C-terminal domain-containing protein n=1 Tax=Pseudonocardia sp. GCM10023141 TaxID=3252653 RepID=UPI003616855B
MSAPTSFDDIVRDGDRILIGTGAGEPSALVAELLDHAAETGKRLEFVQVTTGSEMNIGAAAEAGHRVLLPVAAPGSSPGDLVESLPLSMRQLAQAIDDGSLRIDGVLFSGSLREPASISAGTCVDVVPVAFDRARFRAVEINAGLPDVAAEPLLPLHRCDLVRHADRPPHPYASAVGEEVGRAIAKHVASLVADGSAIELGVGRALALVPAAMAEAGLRLSVHSGMISDWTQQLVADGVASLPLACGGGRPVIGAVAIGSPAFYTWLDGSEAVLLVDSRHAHDPLHLGSLGNFVAINGASAVDLTGQVGATRGPGDRRGPGGLPDFAVGGMYGGRSIIAIESTDSRGRSRIVPRVDVVHLTGTLVSHVVTEHGVAALAGMSWSRRRRALIDVAHPDHRRALEVTV